SIRCLERRPRYAEGIRGSAAKRGLQAPTAGRSSIERTDFAKVHSFSVPIPSAASLAKAKRFPAKRLVAGRAGRIRDFHRTRHPPTLPHPQILGQGLALWR